MLQDMGNRGTGEMIKDSQGQQTHPMHAETLLSPHPSQPRAGPQSLPLPAHNRHQSGQPQALSIMEGACLCYLVSRVCVHLPSSSLAAWAAGLAHTSHQEEAFPASSPSPLLPSSPSPWPLTAMLEFPRTSASRAAPHPHLWEPAASRAQPSGLSPPLSPGPSHSPSPSAPSSSFQPEEKFCFPSLTQRDFPVGLRGSWGGRGVWGSFTFPMRAVPTPGHLS